MRDREVKVPKHVSEKYDFDGQHFVCRVCKAVSVTTILRSEEWIEHKANCPNDIKREQSNASATSLTQ